LQGLADILASNPTLSQVGNNGTFIQAIEKVGEEYIVLFYCEKNLHTLATATDIFIDGTFKVIPRLSKKEVLLLGLHCDVDGTLISCLFGLLCSKNPKFT
jgi:hypothetical protein